MRGRPVEFTNFSKGLNTTDGPYVISTGECRDALNVVSTTRGSIERRYGNVTHGDAASSPLTCLYGFETSVSNNPVKWLLGAADTSMYRWDAAGVRTSIKSSLTADRPWDFETFPSGPVPGSPGYAWAMNGTNTPFYWTGNSVNTGINWATSGTANTNALANSGVSTLQFASVPAVFAVGAVLSGTGINTGTTVTATTSTTVTLSQPTTASISSGTTITATNPGSVPNGKYVVQWQGRLWVAGVTGFGSRLYYSDIANPFSWTATNTADFDTADGEDITGIGTVGSYLLIFKRSKVWVVYDVDPTLGPLNRVVSRNVGCCSHRSIVETPKGTMFLTPDRGVWITNGSRVEDLSIKVRPSFKLNNALEQQAVGAFYKNHYYVTFPSYAATAANDLMMDYDLAFESWWKHSCAMQDMTLWRSSTTSGTSLYGARYAANGTASLPGIDRLFDSTTYRDNDSTSPYLSYWHSPWHAFEVPHVKKRLRRMTFDGAGSFSAYIATDFGAQWIPYAQLSLSSVNGDPFGQSALAFGSETWVFGGTSTAIPARVFGVGGDIRNAKTGVGRTISIRFESSSNSAMTINAYTMAVGFRKN